MGGPGLPDLIAQARPRWHARAACRSRPGLSWFSRADVEATTAVCAACPVAGQCRDVGQNEFGVWGGVAHRMIGAAPTRLPRPPLLPVGQRPTVCVCGLWRRAADGQRPVQALLSAVETGRAAVDHLNLPGRPEQLHCVERNGSPRPPFVTALSQELSERVSPTVSRRPSDSLKLQVTGGLGDDGRKRDPCGYGRSWTKIPNSEAGPGPLTCGKTGQPASDVTVAVTRRRTAGPGRSAGHRAGRGRRCRA
jgi:hypothetical protein